MHSIHILLIKENKQEALEHDSIASESVLFCSAQFYGSKSAVFSTLLLLLLPLCLSRYEATFTTVKFNVAK